MSGEVWFDGLVDTHEAELVAFRRLLHREPELSGREVRTTERVVARLRAAGLDPQVLPSGTGLWCDVGEGEGLRLALRADLDALAMSDEKDVPYRSGVPGVAHACGHDVHTAIVLGAGLVLADAAPGQVRPVRLVFEPSEETMPGGALDVIAAGGLDGVGDILGVHCDVRFAAGVIGARVGPASGAADRVDIVLHGPGGHTARPEETVDLVALAGRMIVELPAAVRRTWPSLALTFGAVHAGDAVNVIPTRAEVGGTLRTPDLDAWAAGGDAVRTSVEAISGPAGATAEVSHLRGVPPVVNDAGVVARFSEAARRALGDGAVVEPARTKGGDTFAWYLEHVAGAYVRIGAAPADGSPPPGDLHAGTFDVDERCIAVGVRALVAAATS